MGDLPMMEEFIDEFIYHPPGECPPTPLGLPPDECPRTPDGRVGVDSEEEGQKAEIFGIDALFDDFEGPFQGEPEVQSAQGDEELLVRSEMVKGMANIYIQRHLQDLGERPHVLKLHASRDHDNLADRFKEHIDRRVDAEYPAAQFGGERGGIPKTIKEAVLGRQ